MTSVPITPQMIRDLLAGGVIKDPDMRTPDVTKLSDLAGEAEWLRSSFERQKPIAWEAQERLAAQLDSVLAELPELIRANAEMAKNYPTEEDKQGAALAEFELAARNLISTGIGWRVFPPVRDWRSFAVPLGQAFRKAMKTANPDLELRLSNAGPISRFLEAITPLISGDCPACETIARHLQREASKGNTTKSPVTV